MKRYGFGAIDLLIGLILMSVLFIIGANAFKGVSSVNINGSSGPKAIQQQVDEQVNEIERMKKEALEYQRQQLEENRY